MERPNKMVDGKLTPLTDAEFEAYQYAIANPPQVDPRESMALTRAEFALASAVAGLITDAEALAWAGGTSLPQFATDAIDATGGTAPEKLAMKIEALTAANVRRTAPTVTLLGASLGMTDAQIDALFS